MDLKVTNNSGEAVTLSNIQVTDSGTGNAAIGIVLVKLMKGASVLATGVYTTANGVVILSGAPLDTIAPGTSQDYTLVYNFSGSAPSGTYITTVAANTDVQGAGQVSGKAIQVSGAPITGATITIVSPTATNSPTSTITSTPTITGTPTATPNGTQVPVIYPNPNNGKNPIHVHPPAYSGTANITVQVFTTAFRKVQEQEFQQWPAGTDVTITLTDNWGGTLANGLYYVIVSNGSDRSVGKLLVIR